MASRAGVLSAILSVIEIPLSRIGYSSGISTLIYLDCGKNPMRVPAIFFALLLILSPVSFAVDFYDAGYSVRGMASITGGAMIDITGSVVAKPANCYETHLPGYREYSDPKVKSIWDGFTAQSEGICRIDRPNLPKDCWQMYELVSPTYGVQGVLCWWGKKEAKPASPSPAPSTPSAPGPKPASPRPAPSPSAPIPTSAPSSAVPQTNPEQVTLDEFAPPAQDGQGGGILGWFRRLFGGGAPVADHPYTPEQAAAAFTEEYITPSELPDGAQILMFPNALAENTVIQDGLWMSTQLAAPAYVAWIDPTPDFMYGHTTIYLVLYPDGVIDAMTGNGWAVINGKDIRSVGIALNKGSGPTGAFGAVTGMAPEETRPARHERRSNHPVIAMLPAPTAPAEAPQVYECPPGYKTIIEKGGEEKGMSLTVVGPDTPRPNGIVIDFPGEAAMFAQATAAAGFEAAGPATSVAALGAALQSAASNLKRPSTFAMFISAHGLDLWKVTVRNTRTGDTKTVDYWPGEPQPQSLGISGSDWEIQSKSRNTWCFQLGNQCVQFHPDIHLAPIPSCRKFLAANSCFSGAYTEHSVPGLSAYASSQKNEPAQGMPPVGGNNKILSQWGFLFNQALAQNPPLNPKKPDEDEPKPEFDGAFNAAGKLMTRGNNVALRNRRGQIVVQFTVNQQPVMSSIPHETGCAESIRCEAPTGGEAFLTCEDRETGAIRTPRWFEKMLADGERFPGDRLETLASMIMNLEALKACGKCPPGTVGGWKNCNPSREGILDAMIAILRSYGQSKFQGNANMVPQLDALVGELMKCKLVCEKPAARIPTGIGVIPGAEPEPTWSCPRGKTHTRKDCERACREVGGSCVEQDRCWSCRVMTGVGSQPQTALTTGQTPTTPTTTSCEEQCAQRGMVTTQPDWSNYILDKLNSEGVCKKNAQVSFGSYLKSDQCTCYPSTPPSVSISGDLSCDTDCGTVPCNSGTSCSCGENCILKVTCNWGGWRQTGAQAYQPFVQAGSSQ